MTIFNYIGLAIEAIFAVFTILSLFVFYVTIEWKWAVITLISFILFILGASVAIS